MTSNTITIATTTTKTKKQTDDVHATKTEPHAAVTKQTKKASYLATTASSVAKATSDMFSSQFIAHHDRLWNKKRKIYSN